MIYSSTFSSYVPMADKFKELGLEFAGSSRFTFTRLGLHEKLRSEKRLSLVKKPPVDLTELELKEREQLALANRRKRLLQRCYAMYNCSLAKKYMNFLTLTFPPKMKNCQRLRALNTLLTRLRKKYGVFLYVWVREPHKSGLYHYHVFVGRYIDVSMLYGFHSEICYNICGQIPIRSSVKIQCIADRDKDRVVFYISKYCSKSDLTGGGRSWGCSQDVSKLFCSEIVSCEAVPFDKCARFEVKCGDRSVVCYAKPKEERFKRSEKLVKVNDFVLFLLEQEWRKKIGVSYQQWCGDVVVAGEVVGTIKSFATP